MKKILYTLLVLPLFAMAQSTDVNYVKNTTYTLPNSNSSGAIEEVTYYDGLGRAIQVVKGKSSGNGKDVVTHLEYDVYNRTAKEYLPYEAVTSNLNFDSNSKVKTQNFYLKEKYENTTNPYSENFFESSPLNRIVKFGAPGDLWKGNPGYNTVDDHTVKFENQTNVGLEVKRFLIAYPVNTETPVLSCPNYYSANQLYKSIIRNENWIVSNGKLNTTEEFKDKQGKIILKRTYNYVPNPSNPNALIVSPHDTYYVYDLYDNLTYVLPPLASDLVIPEIVNVGTMANVDSLCYIYKYDKKNRIIEKQIPDNGWTSIVYDNLDRPILIQTAAQKLTNSWSYTKYDALGRVIMTGIHTNTASRSNLQIQVVRFSAYENRSATLQSTLSGGARLFYSNNNAFPATGEIHTINYYDSYLSVVPLDTSPQDYGVIPESVYGETTGGSKNLPTVSYTKILGNSAASGWIIDVLAYDAKGRQIWNRNINNLVVSQTEIQKKIDFRGNVLISKTIHSKNNTQIIVEDQLTYDNQMRLVKQTQQINGGDIEVLYVNKFDELGTLIQKKVGGLSSTLDDQKELQKIDYKYNIRGWLAKLNNINDTGKDLFAYELGYTGLYNGNISSTRWRNGTSSMRKDYLYTYDHLNRLNQAEFFEGSVIGDANAGPPSGTTIMPKYSEQDITYDKNGNILNLTRRGLTSEMMNLPETYSYIDVLSYIYKDKSNQLLKVTDTSGSSLGFNDGNISGNDYNYDVNGNMIMDLNKGLVDKSITYNHLNLPTDIVKATQKIKYLYSANGKKLEKIFTSGSVQTSTQYINGFVYKNNVLEYFPHSEGYVRRESNGTFTYVYQFKDHLGNVRMSYADIDKDGSISDAQKIDNGGFEAKTGWSNIGTSVSYSGSKKNSGEVSLLIQNTTTGKIVSESLTGIPINNTQPTSYTISGTVWVSGQGYAGLELVMTTATNTVTTSLAGATVTSGWTPVQRTVLVPANVRKLSVRLSLTSQGTAFFDDVAVVRVGGSEIISSTDYYPFGMQHIANSSVISSNLGEKIKYNGKELQDELGLNVYDYGWRNYMPDIGRWMQVDPLHNDLNFAFDDSQVDEDDEDEVFEAILTKAEIGDGIFNTNNLNPYAYGYNNPVVYDDPDGRCPVCIVVAAMLLYSEFANAPTGNARDDSRNYNASKSNRTIATETILKRGSNLLVTPGSKSGVSSGKPTKAETLAKNKQQGKEFEKKSTEQMKKDGHKNIQEQVTIKPNGEKGNVRLDKVSTKDGKIKLTEDKSSKTAPLTKNQKNGFPAIEKNGGTVVGKGKAGYPGGTQIPPTKVDVKRPN